MPVICNIKLKIRNPKDADAMSRLGLNAGELNDALVTTMKNGRLVWDVADGIAAVSFDMDETGYTKKILKAAVDEFKDDDEIDCEMNFMNEMPSMNSLSEPPRRKSFFTRVVNGVRGWFS